MAVNVCSQTSGAEAGRSLRRGPPKFLKSRLLSYQTVFDLGPGILSGTRANPPAHVPASGQAGHRPLLQPPKRRLIDSPLAFAIPVNPPKVAAGDPPIPCKARKRTDKPVESGGWKARRSGSLSSFGSVLVSVFAVLFSAVVAGTFAARTFALGWLLVDRVKACVKNKTIIDFSIHTHTHTRVTDVVTGIPVRGLREARIQRRFSLQQQ
ncbi:hypothetical protein LIA77_07636 [Sarocladium implicatum]|nr:hypothetical protein LIA77_07636 [Sarocladium implicatum]